MNIAIFGFMGTGKSSVARALARRLSLPWLDMDRSIEDDQGLTIEEIFEKRGEDFFRRLERRWVQELVRRRDLVVSTGGGVPLNPKNVEDFEKWGLCVCLNADLATILDRTRYSERGVNRPLIARLASEAKREGADPVKRIEELVKLRESHYRRIPIQIDTTGKSVHDVVETILALVKAYTKREQENRGNHPS